MKNKATTKTHKQFTINKYAMGIGVIIDQRFWTSDFFKPKEEVEVSVTRDADGHILEVDWINGEGLHLKKLRLTRGPNV